MPEQMSTAAARDLLAAAVKQAEQNLLARLAAGQGKNSVLTDPSIALMALATYTGFVVEGGQVRANIGELLQVIECIATDLRYPLTPAFPLRKPN